MSTIKTDPATNDLVFENNKLVIISGAAETEQRLRARLRMFMGEWFLNLARGTPYRQTIFEKGTPPDTIAAAIKREILTVAGVKNLLQYEQDYNSTTRGMSVKFKILTSDDEIVEISEAMK